MHGVLEIKLAKNWTLLEASDKFSFCLTTTLKRQIKKHAYYYQIQLQMKLSEAHYGDFVVWSESELVVLRITLVQDFIKSAIQNV